MQENTIYMNADKLLEELAIAQVEHLTAAIEDKADVRRVKLQRLNDIIEEVIRRLKYYDYMMNMED